jgi:hypothetical protein
MDWLGRIDELAHYLSTEYRVEDRGALEVLLAALVDCLRTPPLWLVLETNYFQRDCSPGWFALGQTWAPMHLSELRGLRSRNANALIGQWLADGRGHCAVECDYDGVIPRYRPLADSRTLLARTLRLRVQTPSCCALSPVDQRDAERRSLQLRALVDDALKDRLGTRGSDPPAWKEPGAFLYTVELAVRLSGRHRDYGQTALLLRSLAVRRAHLYGRREADESDWGAIERVILDSIPLWVMRVIERLAQAEGLGATCSKAPARLARSETASASLASPPRKKRKTPKPKCDLSFRKPKPLPFTHRRRQRSIFCSTSFSRCIVREISQRRRLAATVNTAL